jgi:hypothetical protein
VWALGCILVEMATLQKAFDSSSISKIILSIMSGHHKPLPPAYSPGLRALAAALLQVDPAARPAVHEILAIPFVMCAAGDRGRSRRIWGGRGRPPPAACRRGALRSSAPLPSATRRAAAPCRAAPRRAHVRRRRRIARPPPRPC